MFQFIIAKKRQRLSSFLCIFMISSVHRCFWNGGSRNFSRKGTFECIQHLTQTQVWQFGHVMKSKHQWCKGEKKNTTQQNTEMNHQWSPGFICEGGSSSENHISTHYLRNPTHSEAMYREKEIETVLQESKQWHSQCVWRAGLSQPPPSICATHSARQHYTLNCNPPPTSPQNSLV